MRYKLIACKSLSRELSYLASVSQNNIDITFLRQGYHEAPSLLVQRLQAEIDAVESGTDPHTNQYTAFDDVDSPQKLPDFDAILLGYGMCSNGIVGLHSRSHTLVVPRAHDCMTLLLGSRARYLQYFKELPGCFWYSGSWIENSAMPCAAYEVQQRAYLEAQGYDEDSIDFCMENMTGWTKSYHHAAYVKMPFFDKPQWQQFTRDAAAYYGWQYHQLDGDLGLMERLLNGPWSPIDFLVVPPGNKIVATNDQYIIGYAPARPEKSSL